MIFHWHLDQSILKYPKFDYLHWWLTRRLCHDLEVMITGDYLKTAIAIARLLLQCLWINMLHYVSISYNMFQVFPSGTQYKASHLVRRVEILQDQDNVADAVPWERNIG